MQYSHVCPVEQNKISIKVAALRSRQRRPIEHPQHCRSTMNITILRTYNKKYKRIGEILNEEKSSDSGK